MMMLRTVFFSPHRTVVPHRFKLCSTAPSQVIDPRVDTFTEAGPPPSPHHHTLAPTHTPHIPNLYSVPVEEQRFLKAAIIGKPNAGKSTLVNQLIGRKVFAVSPKKHTTLHKAMGVFTEGSTQVVILDTPGLISYHEGRKLRVSKQFLTDPARSTMEANIIMVMVDIANKYTREKLDRNIVQILADHQHIPSVLILNKVDLLSHKHVLLSVAEGLTGTSERGNKMSQITALTRKLRNRNLSDKVRVKFEAIISNLKSELGIRDDSTHVAVSNGLVMHPYGDGVDNGGMRSDMCHGWPHFRETFMVSSLNGDGVDPLKEYLLCSAPKGVWQYLPCEVTDKPTLGLVEDIVREKLFKYLEKEIPYVITQSNVHWDHNKDGTLVIYQNINCKTDKQASIVIGPAGRTIQAITREASDDIRQLLNCTVDLTLYVRTHSRK